MDVVAWKESACEGSKTSFLVKLPSCLGLSPNEEWGPQVTRSAAYLVGPRVIKARELAPTLSVCPFA